jgi:hypothetical protein
MAHGRVAPFVGSLALALLALAASSGCSKDKCEPCAVNFDCGSDMVCQPDLKVCKPKGDKPACSVECSESPQCKELALCTLKGNRCVVGELDCSKSAQCTDEGKCTRQDLGDFGTCVTINAGDCVKSTSCRTAGHCSVDRKSRQCRALSDGDCKQAEICKKEKKCKANNQGECVVGEP